MPRLPDAALPQFVAGADPRTNLRGVPAVEPISFRGVNAAVHDVQTTLLEVERANQAEANRAKAEADRKREKLAHDEASSAVHNTVSQGRAMWTEELLKAKSAAPSDVAGFTDGILKRFDSWAETASGGVPELAKPLLKDRLGELRSQLNIHAFEYEMKARGAAIVADYNKGAEADALTLLADPTQITPLLAQRMALARTLNVPPEDRATMEEGVRHKLAYAAAQGLLRAPDGPDQVLARLGMTGTKTDKQGNRIAPDPAKAAEAVKSDPIFSNMSPDHVRMIADQATMAVAQREAQKEQDRVRREAQAQAASERRAREAAQAWDVVYRMTRDGIPLDMRDPNNKALVAKMDGTPFAAGFTQMQSQAAANTAAAVKPLDDQQREIDALYARRRADGSSQALDEEIGHREKVRAAAVAEAKNDPLRTYARRVSGQTFVPLNFSTPQTLVASLVARAPTADDATRWLGKSTDGPAGPAFSDEVPQIRQYLETLPAKQRAGFVSELSVALSQSAAVGLALQMGKESRAVELALKSATDRTGFGRYTSELIFAGEQAMKDQTSTKGKKEPEVVAGKWKADISTRLGDVFGDQVTANDFRDKALLIAHAKAAEAGGSVDIDEAINLALHGSLIEGRGRQVLRNNRAFRVPLPVPVGIDEDALDKRLRSLKPADIGAGTTVIAGGSPMPTADFLRALPGQELIPVRPGVYSVIVNGRPVMHEDGRRRVEIGVR